MKGKSIPVYAVRLGSLLEIVVELARSSTAFRANIHGIADAVYLLAEIKLYALNVPD
jgi:hypothetical protein